MTCRSLCRPSSRVVCTLALATSAATVTATDSETHRQPPARVYTNADLARVAPYRDQTGVASVPASSPREEPSEPPARVRGRAGTRRAAAARDTYRDEAAARQREETYWRREAARHQQRQRQLTERLDALRRQAGRGRRGSGVSRAQREEQLRLLEEQRRQEDEEFEERARRAGALPGWLR
jgi:hypothetical protein